VLLKYARKWGRLKGVNISSLEILTHLLFMDDVLLFGAGTPQKFQVLKGVLKIFYKA
jgi:hypothetical protein